MFAEHYRGGGTLSSFAALTVEDLTRIGIAGVAVPEARELAAWAAEIDWTRGGDVGGTWSDLSTEQRGQIVEAYLEGVR